MARHRGGAAGAVHRGALAVVVILGALCWSTAASAQRQPFDRGLTMDLQLFLPPPGGGATFTIDDATVPRHMTFVVGLGFSHAAGVLERQNTETDEVVEIVPRLTQIELLAAIGLFEVMEVGLALPFVLLAAPPDPMTAISMDPMVAGTSGISDPRITLKVPLLRGDFGLAARASFHIPIAGRDDGEQSFRSMGYWQSAWGAVASYTAGALTLAGELAWRMRRRAALPGLEQDDELHLAGGLAYAITPLIAPIFETQIRIGVGGRTLGPDEAPAEADLGVRITPGSGLSFDAGGGTGLRQGWGTPSWRVFLVARYATERETCPAGPEDYDGYEDGDYCNDPDNDRDQRPDTIDECPNDAEDVDSFVDDDGCPDSDNDADGVLDGTDACPTESEDRDGFEDTDGCPEPDNDRDQIPDGPDDCPNEAEDRDSFQDDDGCPEPGPQRATVTVTETRILISERIYFDFDRDTIRSVSQPLLDQVAAVILEIGGNRRIRVEGYTDNQGIESYNTDLSYRRARAVVEYLSGRGVPRPRLDFVGYGSQRPVAPNDTEDGRALNRRVEFTIIEAGDQPTPPQGGGRRNPR